ncbi:hypothetical protein IEQ34_019891 [Dendrobium chrysotoxum]|uniref:J domain-containing protein n=1 Tax=Dendrobium chrysotoxum TaxID=161865 RepID=A0AAV7G8J2_DENCH|nr:hypothetical protein IEQ34_019891 [Dendrobium chrysotoxum]
MLPANPELHGFSSENKLIAICVVLAYSKTAAMEHHDGAAGSIDGAGPTFWLANAELLLASGDFIGAKTFAERALEADPLVIGADNLLAVVEVLLAANRYHVDNVNQIDWYSILQIEPSSSSDPAAVRRHFRRLALLLRPELNQLPFAGDALKLVLYAWSILSDPAKKSLFDSERRISVQPASTREPDFWSSCPFCHHAHNYKCIYEGRDVRCQNCRRSFRAAALPVFWTACSFCFHVYEYDGSYEGRTLRCQTCRRPFRATSLLSAPPIVPGTDMYFCSWGFFPLGFESEDGARKHFFSMAPENRPQQAEATKDRDDDSLVSGKRGLMLHRQVVAKKRVGFTSRRRFLDSGFGPSRAGRETRPENIDINKEWESCS